MKGEYFLNDVPLLVRQGRFYLKEESESMCTMIKCNSCDRAERKKSDPVSDREVKRERTFFSYSVAML